MSESSHPREFEPSAQLADLAARSDLLRKLRDFFHERGFVEVETPLVSDEVIPELHIEPMSVGDCPRFLSQGKEPRCGPEQEKGTVPFGARKVQGDSPLFSTSISSKRGDDRREKGTVPKMCYLQASPELHMKRLLAAGATAIFQVTRSFRSGERGRLHNPEFTIVEWYRVADDLEAGMDLLDELAQSLFGAPPATRTTYAEAFERHVGVCPHTATIDELETAAGGWGRATVSPQLVRGLGARQELDPSHPQARLMDRNELLNLLLATRVEPQLGRDRPEIIYHYPASQASLAKVAPTEKGFDVAERFELYYRGVELANGFHELTDAVELRGRLEAVNAARVADARPPLPMPESLLAAMKHGLPDCTGCALGFDRLAMLAIGATSIDDVIAFPTERS